MTNKEIEKYREKDLKPIVKRLNEIKGFSLSAIGELNDANSKLNNILEDISSLAEKVGASQCIGPGWFLIEKSYSDVNPLDVNPLDIKRKDIVAKEAVITEIISGINNALQTEAMLNACVSAEQSSITAKWACVWAAIAAIASCISVLLVLFCA